MNTMPLERVPITNVSAANASAFVEDIERYQFACRYVANKRVLDLACGTGYGADMLARIGRAAIVHAFDTSDVAIVQAAGTYRSPQLQFRVGKAEEIPLPDASVDVAVSMETFEHLKSPELFLKELRRALIPGGVLIISTPRNESDERFRPVNPYHVREYSAEEFRSFLTSTFETVSIWSQLTDYEDDVTRRSAGRSVLGEVARKVIPPFARRLIRRSIGSRGLVPARSCIVEGENVRAAYQIAVCQ